MSLAESLLHLQDIELAFVRGQKRLQEITAALADDAQVSAASAELQAAEGAVVPLRAKARNLELEIQSNTQKANASEDQLYSGKVKATKEMQDLQAEIEALRRRKTELEETLLETMMSLEEAEATQTSAEAHLASVRASRGDAMQALIDEQTTLQAQIATLREQRKPAMAAIPPDVMSRYSALRQPKNYQPVSVLRDESCTVCGVEQTMAIVRQVQLGQSLATCLNCGRILVSR
jgi:predicted  nucleic acid-binding Zn-ribbon protein